MIENCLELLGISEIEPNEAEFILDEVSKYIFNVNERHSNGEKTFDLKLDYKYYFVDFLKLGINFNTDDISLWEFDVILELLFLDENSNLSKMLAYRIYEKPPKNPKTHEEREHRFRMQMKRKYALPNKQNVENGLEKLFNYVEKKVGENK